MLVSSLSFLPHCEIPCSWDSILFHLSIPRKMRIIPNTWSEPFPKSPFISQLLRVNTVFLFISEFGEVHGYISAFVGRIYHLANMCKPLLFTKASSVFRWCLRGYSSPFYRGGSWDLREVRSGAQVTQLVMVGRDFECGAWFLSNWVYPLISLGILITLSRTGLSSLTSAKNLGNEPINCLKFSIFSCQSFKWLWSETCWSFVISLWYLSLKSFLSSTSLVKIQFFLISSFCVLIFRL